MCLGSIELLTDVWSEGSARVGRTQAGRILSLAFAPEAGPGSYVLAYAGCAVEVVDAAAAAQTIALQTEAEAAS
jgi:hydrogenase maturation factor